MTKRKTITVTQAIKRRLDEIKAAKKRAARARAPGKKRNQR